MRINAHKILDGKPEGKRPLGRPCLVEENNIKMDMNEYGMGRDFLHTVMKLGVS